MVIRQQGRKREREKMRTLHQVLVQKAEKLYSKGGQAEVLAFFTNIGHKNWADCKPCEWESPISENTCLVCGSSTEREKQNGE
jgi:hypothetical protein